MSGASPAQAVVADLAFFYRRETRDAPRFSLVGGGTATGIADAARGIVDAGLSGRALTAGDPRGLVFTPLALSAVCLVTNPANRVPNLTRAQLQDLVAGRDDDLGAGARGRRERRDRARRVRPDLGRAQRLPVGLRRPRPRPSRPPTPRSPASAQVRDYIAATPAASGYVDLEFARRLHAVPYEGVAVHARHPGRRHVPGAAQLGFVTRAARGARWPVSCSWVAHRRHGPPGHRHALRRTRS